MSLPDSYYKILVEKSLDIVTILSKTGVIEYESPAVTTFLGYNPEENIGKNSLTMVHPMDVIHITTALSDGILQPGKKKLVHFRYRHKNGSYKVLESHAQYINDNDFDGVVVISRDITDIREKDEQIKLLSTAIEKTDNIVFMTDPNGMITFINPAFSDAYGYSKEEVIMKVTPRILKSGKLDNQVYSLFWKTIKNKQHFSGEFINKRKDGSLITVGVSANPVLDDAGLLIGFISIQYDLTRRIDKEEELKKKELILQEKNSELERINRLMVDRELKMIELKKQIKQMQDQHSP
jgi:PAS domain S-box-containing protein